MFTVVESYSVINTVDFTDLFKLDEIYEYLLSLKNKIVDKFWKILKVLMQKRISLFFLKEIVNFGEDSGN